MTVDPTAVTRAIMDGNLARVQSMIADHSLDVNTPQPWVVLAARHRQTDIMRVLLSAGADVNAMDTYGTTAIHMCISNLDSAALGVLIEHGADLALEDARNLTPIEFAIVIRKTRWHLADNVIVALLAARALLRPHQAMVLAVMSTVITSALVDIGIDVGHLRDSQQRTPLHVLASAIAGHSYDFDATLLDFLVNRCGVDVDARDCDGDTALHIAGMRDKRQLFRWLLDAGADINATNVKLNTPLHVVAVLDDFRFNSSVVLLLLAAGADADVRAICADRLSRPVKRLLLGADMDTTYDGISMRTRLSYAKAARKQILRARLDFVRARALEICIALQGFKMNALQMCEILLHACGPVAPMIEFHQWWQIATTVKHFHSPSPIKIKSKSKSKLEIEMNNWMKKV
jgi:ankyrin repeat protein